MPASFGGVEREVLLLRHLDGDRGELAQPGAAAELATARTDATDQAGLVAGADLPHLDAGVQRLREVAHQRPEVDARLRHEVEHRLAAVEAVVDADELRVEAVPLGERGECAVRALLLRPVVVGAAQVAAVGAAQDAWQPRVLLVRPADARRADHLAQLGSALALHHHQIVDAELERTGVVRAGTARDPEADVDDVAGRQRRLWLVGGRFLGQLGVHRASLQARPRSPSSSRSLSHARFALAFRSRSRTVA